VRVKEIWRAWANIEMKGLGEERERDEKGKRRKFKRRRGRREC